MSRKLKVSFLPLVFSLAAIACSSNAPAPQGGTGGQGSGGVAGNGGKTGSGGASAGGTAGNGSGGVSGSGGSSATGGTPATGGSSAAGGGSGKGGSSGTGGSIVAGGTTGTGGNSSGQTAGTTGVGGSTAKGGTTSMAGGEGGTSSSGAGGGAGTTGSGGTTPASGGRSGADAGTSTDGPGSGGRNSGGSGGAGGQSTSDASTSTGGSGGGTGYNPCKASPCVILPLGDSITHGFGSTDDAGYRSGLFKLVVAANQNVTFIGSLTNPTAALTVSGKTFPAHHEGHDGITVSGITGYVPPAKALAGTPHIVLLHIGTNDMTSNADPTTTAKQLDTLVTDLVKAAPDALILVAKIIPLFYTSTTYNNYVAQIPGIVSTHAANGEHVVMVDMTSFPSNDYGNGVHPSDTGYAFMANLWYQAIKGYLP